ncbi:MAG: DUF488 domain-containing protein [Acidobacteria bacterium]|nr:DUF488 domain-containing protein [Acidobacteriota bacterium]MCA1632842.1 DUF488 domain-containing protein [Acidobacteriota bacterium]MCA1640978.1 DUF488 domain-containing protein [Acidobacteriota bacterium]
MPTPATITVYTIGHGRHPWAEFLALLRRHEIELLCDVRSVARSRWVQFNGQVLEASLRRERIGYEWLPECGGKKIAPPADLARGLDRVVELASDARACIMCSESHPLTKHKQPRANCHRVGLLSTPLRERGARVVHILPDGETLELDEASLPSIW